MKTNSLYRKLLLGVVMLAAVFALAGAFAYSARWAAAQTTEATPAPDSDSAPSDATPADGVLPPFGHGMGRRSGPGHYGAFTDRTTINQAIADALGIDVSELEAAYADGTRWQELADELGVDVATVQAAINDAVEAGIAAAVADGSLTQAEADVMLEQMALHELAQTIVSRDVVEAAIAATLGVSVDEMQAAKADGTLRDLIEASGVTHEELHAAAEAARSAQIEQALADGVITQEQADQLLAMPAGPHGFGGPGGRGGRGGHHGHGMPGGPFDAQPDAPAVDSEAVDA